MKQTVCVLIMALFFGGQLSGQEKSLDYVYVEQIIVEGNRKTKEKVILRELKFKLNEKYLVEELKATLEESEMLLMNTGLFNNVTVTIKNWIGATNAIVLKVEVRENWYFYPAPIFELADRNFNVWWKDQNRSLDRVKIGGEFAHINFTGHNDRLKASVKFGFTNSMTLSYRLPYINKKQTLGLFSYVSYSRERQVDYISSGNKQVFFGNEEKFVFQKFKSELALTYRPKIRISHEFILSFTQDQIDQIIIDELNPLFFTNNDNFQRFLLLGYKLTVDQTDIRPYPLKGYRVKTSIEKSGLGVFNDINAFKIEGSYSRFFTLKPDRWYFSVQTSGKLSLIRSRQPYKYNRAIGFNGHSLHGFELYNIDGLDMAYIKTTLRFKFLEKKINFGKLMPLKPFRHMPLKLLLTFNNDSGYVNGPFSQENNPLNNRILWGGGIGLDLVVYYDKVFQIEYSFNDLLENGLFLNFDLNF